MTSTLPTLLLAAVAELAQLRQWVLWRFVQRPGASKPTKVPVTTTGRAASTTDPSTWSSFDDVSAAQAQGVGDGAGFVFAESDPFVGVDLDGCIGDDGALAPWAQRIVEEINSYTEKSPSGSGLHIIAKGKLPPGARRRGSIEAYSEARYFAMTGQHLAGTPTTIEQRDGEVAAFHAEHLGGGGQHAGAPEVGPLVLRRDAEPPADRLAALIANAGDFARTWRHERSDLRRPDGSDDLSAFDLALVNYADRAAWTDQQIADLVIAHRRTHGWHEKVLRTNPISYRGRTYRGYIARTIAVARSGAEDVRDAEDAGAQVDGDGAGEQGDDEPGALPLDRAAALEQIRVALGMPEIEGFEREGRQPVVYRVVLKGQTVTVGGASKLRQQAAFRDALFDATGRWPTRVKKRSEWERLTAMMHRIAERIEVGEGDADIAMVSLVADYCGYGGAVDVVDPDRMTVEWSRPGRRAEPYIIGGRLHVQLRALAQHALQQGERVSIEQLARRLRRIGFAKAAPKTLRLIPEVVAQYASGDASDLKAMRTTLRAWVLVPGKCPDLDSMVAQVVRADARERREQAERRS